MFQATLRRVREARVNEIEGEEAAEAGFTLIELMVVLLIIAILLAIAIPTFLGVTNTAGDRAAQSNLTNALTEAKALYQVSQTYSTASGPYTTAQFTSQAPEFTWTTSNCTSAQNNCISYAVFSVATSGDGQGLSLAAYSSKTNTCWYAFDLEASPLTSVTIMTFPTAGVFYGKQTLTGTTKCQALTDAAVTGFSSSAGTNYSNAASIS